MKLLNCFFSVLLLGNCSNDFRISPASTKNTRIFRFEDKIILSADSISYVCQKKFGGKNCPDINYNQKYFNKTPFFVKRLIPVTIDSNLEFIDYYGRSIDSLRYEELEVIFFLDGSQTIKLHKVFILKECFTVGNDVKTEILNKRNFKTIAREWGVQLIK